MPSYEDLGSEWRWSILSPMGDALSINLPKTVRTFEEFIKVDLYTGDSDPVYWGVVRAYGEWGYEWATKFSVAMLAYYHTGTAVRAAEYSGEQFWNHLEGIYDHAARGSERRHFRGPAGAAALHAMRRWSPDPVKFFDNMGDSYQEVRKVCETALKQFGPYFQLKVVDYMECLDKPMSSMRGLERNLPSEPAKAVGLMYPGKPVDVAFELICNSLPMDLYTPIFGRHVGPAEVETSLCGWKTTKFKGNWFGADIKDKRDALVGWGDKALEFRDFLPALISKTLFKIELE